MKKGWKKNRGKKAPQSEVWAIFCREDNLDRIRNIICDAFEVERLDGGSKVKVTGENCSVEVIVLLPSMGEDEKKFVFDEKNAMCGFYSQLPEADEDIKINLCHHIQQARAFISVCIEALEEGADMQADLDGVRDLMVKVTEQVEGVFIVEHGAVALGVVDGCESVILSADGRSDLESYFPFTLEEHPKFLEGCTEGQKKRRDRNMKYLFDRGIYVCELPLNEDEESVSLRSKEEVARRMLGVLATALYSEAMLNPAEHMTVTEAGEFIGRVMGGLGIEDPEEILTPEELAYLRDDAPEEQTKIDYSWNYEHLYLLEWILGLAEWNDPVEICDVGLMVRNIKGFHSVEEICEKTTMRSPSEILDKADLIYRMDWAAVDARIHRMSGPAGLVHGVVQARHKTLNWMIRFGGDEWDDVDTPT